MSPVPATVPADAVLRTINCRDDYSSFLLLIGVHHSTIRPADLRLSASKSAPRCRANSLDAWPLGSGERPRVHRHENVPAPAFGGDICSALEITAVGRALARLDDDDK